MDDMLNAAWSEVREAAYRKANLRPPDPYDDTRGT